MPEASASQANGSALGATTVNPSGSDSGKTTGTTDSQAVSQQVAEWKSKYDEAQGKLGQVQEFYKQYPKIVEATRKYAQDPDFAKRLDGLIDGNGDIVTKESEKTVSDDFSGFDESQKKAVQAIVEQRVNEVLTSVRPQLERLQNENIQAKIDGWRKQYTPANGYPLPFKDVEPKIAELLNSGQAINAELAYKQILADHYISNRPKEQQELRQAKLTASMARTSVPKQMAGGRGGADVSFEDAFAAAMEKAGLQEE